MAMTTKTDRVALVNGGASGIGLLAAQRFAEAGARVVVVDINDEAAETAAAIIRSAGGSAKSVKADSRRYDEVVAAVQTAIEDFGRLDVLLNCAGGSAARVFGRSEPFEDLEIGIVDWGIDVNLRGPLYYCHAVFPHMKSNHSGVIINLGSVDGTTGTQAVDYGTAKSGLIGLTKSLAIHGAPYGIRVCCVSPGPVLTRPEMAKLPTLLGRAAEPHEVVDLIEYLCSEKASFITGTNYLIDGGKSCGLVSHPAPG